MTYALCRARWKALLPAGWLLALMPSWAAAQTPPPAPPGNVVTPSVVPRAGDLASPADRAGTQADLPPQPAPPKELGKPEDDLRIEIRRFEVDASAPAELRAHLDELTRDLTGPDRGFEDLLLARSRVTRYLQSTLGYYLGYAYIPEQAFSDGTVRIAVLEGRLDRVVLRWPDKELPVRREVVQAYLDRLKPGEVLKVRDVERVVFLVNDLRGMRTRFEVQPGSLPGTANLVVVPAAEPSWSARADVDANGSRYLGLYRAGALGQLNSPFGRGDGLTGNVMLSSQQGLAFALLGYTSPVGGDGVKLGASLSAVQYQLDKSVFQLDLNGTASTVSAYALYPVERARNLNLFTVGTLESKRYEDRQGAANRSTVKEVQTLSLGLTGDFRDAALGGGVNTYDATLVAGELRYPGGRPGALEDAPQFVKLGFGFSRLQDLLFIAPSLQDRHSGKVLAYVSVRGQLTAHNLDTTEQFRIGGPDGVRAFAPGEGTGDEGVVMSLEARLLPPESWFGRLSNEMVISAFVDVGSIRYRHRPSSTAVATLPNTDTFSAAGLAVSWVRPGAYAVRASVATPLSGTPRSDTSKPSARLYLSASKYFE